MFQLRNWHLEMWGDEVIGCGNCYGNPQFVEGFYIHTSTVLKIGIEDEEKWLKLFTHSGSCYVLDFADICECSSESTKEAFQIMNIPFDVDECLALRQQRIEKTKARVLGVLNSNELYVEMTGVSEPCEAYFKTIDGSIFPITISYHVATYGDDSALVTDWYTGLCDWRILLGNSAVVPYHWSDGLDAVRIKNLGNDFIFKGTDINILCKRGQITVIKHEHYRGEGVFSPDTVNGKSVFFSGKKGAKQS